MDRPRLISALSALRGELASLDRAGPAAALAAGVDRALLDLDALRFHLDPPPPRPVLVLLGGTGTGKSTLTNRLLQTVDAPVTASSFRRTFTAGPVAIVGSPGVLPTGWLGLTHDVAASLPARGEFARVVIAERPGPSLLESLTLVDTPDVDGDVPDHHALADRAFRWASAVLFLVSPEKYQMTELLPYFKLADRYGVPATYAMNKAEDPGPVDDFAQQLRTTLGRQVEVYAIPRDDSTYQPPPERSLDALRDALSRVVPAQSDAGLARRAADAAGRVNDQVVEPLRGLRRQADRAVAALRELRSHEAGVDVDPMTRQLRRRMQQRSVLYLMGPQRMLERLKGTPAMLARLPRTTLDLFRGKPSAAPGEPVETQSSQELPDFAAMVGDQFGVVQERIADVLRDAGGPQLQAGGDAWRMDPKQASAIVDDELAQLRAFLEQRWNANPRDTALILKVVKKLPGGERLTQLSESAPYLVVIACGLNHLAFSGLDLLVIGGFSLATWLGEKVSDEVGRRTRQANANIDERFEALVRQQIGAAITWLDGRVPDVRRLDALARHLDDLMDAAGPA